MLSTMKELLKTKDTCVLATCSDSTPHCSLMAFSVSEDGSEICMATHRTTRKFRNITVNPAVSLLIDARENVPRPEAWALTVEGQCAPVGDESRARALRDQLLAAHPQLQAFLAHEDAVIVVVKITSFLLLRGLTDATYAGVES